MSGQFSLLRDTRHLQAVALGLIVLGGGLIAARSHLIPKSFGEHGPYRGDALREIAAQQPVLTSDTSCLKCHESVHEERAESPHKDVACLHCHGNGHEPERLDRRGHQGAAELSRHQPGRDRLWR